ncbi:ABC transporter permease [Spongiimicrobium sp. 3-5]|uniref:ABC transporter permease n=1 Tax=Spongiimicrobium sp. 3-5 TaxID=3332596 RepID=UPI00397ED500
MFKNHLKIALRSIKKERLFAFIKIGGFAIGIGVCLLIALFIRDELSYDTHYKNQDSVFRVLFQTTFKGTTGNDVHFPAPFARALKADIPEIEKSGRFLHNELFGTGSKEIRLEGDSQNTFENGFIYADNELLQILETKFLYGDAREALTEPATLVISKEKADKFFPAGNALGQTVILDNDISKPFKITGVLEDNLPNSHFNYDFIMSSEGRDFYPGEDDNWRAQNYYTYVQLKKQARAEDVEKKMHSIIEDYLLPVALEAGYVEAEEVYKTAKYHLQPVGDVYLKSSGIFDSIQYGDILFVWLFGAIAIFILVLACINFINLSTAKSANRAKEVGLRKTVGAFRTNLVSQFLTESVLFSVVSFILGLFLAWALLPYFNTIANKSLTLPWQTWWFLPIILISALTIGVLAGLYPAFYLSGFRPINVLRGKLSIGSKSGKLRSSLVVFQFTTSVILIIGTLVIYKQMDFIVNKKLGYEKDKVLLVQGASTLNDKTQSFKEQLLLVPGVTGASVSDYLPVEGTKRNGNTFWENGMEREAIGVPGQRWLVDHDYIKTLGMRMVSGRDFSKDIASDSTEAAIINAKMAKNFGFENPLGKKITNSRGNWTIIGVVEDFHFYSLKQDIEPLVLNVGNSANTISVKLNNLNNGDTLKAIAGLWENLVPNQSFRYSFLAQDFLLMHQDVKQMGDLLTSFALFALLVACLGLFALSAFTAEQRRKEISIRMVLGASFKNIYQLLSVNFLKLVAISILIATPIGWYLMNRWLQDFAYPVGLGWDIFLLAGMVALIIAILTISYQSVAAALIKPLNSLRSE